MPSLNRLRASAPALAAALGAVGLVASQTAIPETVAETLPGGVHCLGAAAGPELLDAAAAAARAAAPGGASEAPPLMEGLGPTAMRVTTRDPVAQSFFNQGLRLAWGFNHTEAIRAFRAAQAVDPDCAMCFWGEAFALGPHVNDALRPENLEPARAALARAEAASEGATAVEHGLIAALARRYDPAEPDAAAREAAWADALGALAAANSDDAHLWTLHAEAMMNGQPWDYWAPGGREPKGRGGEIVAALERALELDPDHIGALHLYIHAVEASADPGRAEPAADRLATLVSSAGHLVHMPSHIYLRVGRYEDSIAANRAAVAADETYLEAAGDAASPLYRYGYFPHNVHFLLVSAQVAGFGEDAIAAAERLAGVLSDDVARTVAFVQAMKTAPYALHSMFSPPDTVLALPDPGVGFPFVQGYRRYARGVAEADRGALEAARGEAAAIRRIAASADFATLEAQGLPARTVLGLAALVVEARVARAEGDLPRAERLLTEAVAMQDALPYMEPPWWHYPVRRSLAAVLLAQGRAQEATLMFERALDEQPNSGWSLAGLAAARRAAGDALGADAAEAALAAAWKGDPALLAPDRL